MSFTHLLSTLQTKSVLDCTANNHQNISAGIEKDAYLREEKQQRPYTTPYTKKKMVQDLSQNYFHSEIVSSSIVN